MFAKVAVAALALASTSVTAAPTAAAQQPRGEDLQKKDGGSGQATYFEAGLGACGWWNSDSDWIVAVNSAQYDGGSRCGQTVTIMNNENGQQATATVADECPTCDWGSLDLSPSLFSNLNNGNMDAGVFSITWW